MPKLNIGVSVFLLGCLGLYAVTALCILFLGRGSFTSFILVFASILYIGAPLFLLSFIFWGVAWYRDKDSWMCYAKRGTVVSLCLAALMFPVWSADRVARYDLDRAKAFCESLLPELKEIHARTGAYPYNISTLSSYENPPWLVRHSEVYSSDGDNFIFSISDIRTVMGDWWLTNEGQSWQDWD